MGIKNAKAPTRYKMTFPAKIVGEPIMTNLSRDFGVTYNMVRGRITDKGAWLTIELGGNSKNLERALAFLRDRGVDVQPVKE